MAIRRPQAECAVCILARAQRANNAGERLIDRGRCVAEFGAVAQHNRGQRLAHQLLGAAIRIFLQIAREAVGETQGQRRDAGIERAVLAIHLTRHRQLFLAILKVPGVECRHVGQRRTYAQIGAELGRILAARGGET